MKIFSYWEGPMPFWIDVCLKSMQRVFGKDLTILDRESAIKLCPDAALTGLHEPAHFADYLRVSLLSRYGGWWIDADTIALKPLRWLHDRFIAFDMLYMTWTNQPRRVLNGYIYAREGSPITQKWMTALQDRLDLKIPIEKWTEIGEGVLTPLVDTVERTKTKEICRERFLPLDVDIHVRKLFEPGDPKDYIASDTCCFGLNHSWMMARRREDMELPIDQWKHSSLLIHRLLEEARCAND